MNIFEEIALGDILGNEGQIVGVGWKLEFYHVDHVVTQLVDCVIYLIDVGIYKLRDCILEDVHWLSIENILFLVYVILRRNGLLDITHDVKR